MKRKIKRKISSILCIAVIASMSNSIVYANGEESVSFKESVQINETVDELHKIKDEVTDRFIIKYTSKSDRNLSDIFEESYELAADKKESRIESVLKMGGIDLESVQNNSGSTDIGNVLSDVSAGGTEGMLFSNIILDKTDTEQLKNDMQVVVLKDKVDSETFVQSILSMAGDDIEYIQPDYCLELSDNKDSSVSLNILPIAENKQTDIIVGTEKDTEVEEVPDIKEEQSNIKADKGTEKTEEALFLLNEEDNQKIDEVIVAVIDSGIETNHTDLQGHIIDGYNFVSDNKEVYDENLGLEQSHGTHIAGIIAETADNAKIMPLKCFENGKAYTSDIIEAIKYAEDNGASIVNCSWGSTDNNKALREAMEQSEMFFVCAAGNSRINVDETPVYPAAFGLDNSISVTSVNKDNGFSYYSNYGMSVDIAAIGRDVESCLPNESRGEMSGTSMSAGFVSGAAAIAKGLKEENVKTRIVKTADMFSHLQNKVKDGRVLNIDNLISDVQTTDVIQCNPKDDFDVYGYQPTPNEEWEQFCSLDNVQIESGEDFTLVLKADGSVWSWGSDVFGSAEKRAKPKKITGLSGITAIDAGPTQAFAVRNDGKVFAWGDNTYGQLGTGNKTKVTVPTEVVGLTGVTKISAGRIHTAAVTEDSKVYIWGNNNRNQLGDGTSNEHIVPTEFTGITGIIDVAAGGSHTVALTGDGKVYAWGDNAYGQLGDGTKTRRSRPVQVKDIPVVSKIAVGANHTYAVTGDGKIYAWGENVNGVLGTSGKTDSKTPIQINGLPNVTDISAGKNHTVVMTEDKTAYAWGDNTYGQLGNGTTVSSAVPVQVEEISDVRCISAGGAHTSAIVSNGRIYAWGSNSVFQMGIENNISIKPLKVDGAENIKMLSSGRHHNLALKENGIVIAWGDNTYGQLGDATNLNRDRAIEVNGLTGIKSIASGHYHSLAIKEDGTVYAWGHNGYGQLGDGSTVNRAVPVKVNGLTDVKAVAAGAYFSLALTEDGTVYSWGRNETGQLGDGTNTDRNIPAPIEELTNVKDIAAGYYSGYAVMQDGTVYGWGANSAQQLCDGTGISRNTPEKADVENVQCISAGLYHASALTNDGNVIVWGYNNYGQLGETGTHYYYVNNMTGISNIQSISAGEYHNLAVNSDGTVAAWGANLTGQLGKAITNNRNTNPDIVPELTNIIAVSAGYGHSTALKTDGTVVAWGNNESGQLGDGSRLFRSLPVLIDGEIKDTHGNSWSDAHEVEINSITTASIDSEEDCDWYTFVVNETGYYNIYTVSSMDTYGELYTQSDAEAGNKLLYNDNRGEGFNFKISNTLQAGQRYYLKVFNTNKKETGNYELHIEQTDERDISESITVYGRNGDEFIVMASVNDLHSFDNVNFELRYNENQVNVIDLTAQSYEKITETGRVGNVEILINEPGRVRFRMVDVPIPDGKIWSGVINLFKFCFIDKNVCETNIEINIVN